MGWFEDLENSIESIITGHKCPKKSEKHPQTTKEKLRGLFNEFSGKVAEGSDAQDSYADVDVHFTHHDLGRLLERKGFTCEDPETMENYLTFIVTHRIFTNRDILAEMFMAPDFAQVPKDLKIQVLALLANRVLNLDDVLTAVTQLKLEEIVLPLMVEVQYEGGPDVLYSKLSKMSAWIPGLYEKLMPLIMEKVTDPKNMIVWAMEYAPVRMQTVLGALVPDLLDKGLASLGDMAAAVFKSRVSFLKKFITNIFQDGTIKWDYDNLKALAEAPLREFRDDLGSAARMFAEFSGIILALGPKKGFEPLYKAWIDWLQESMPERGNYVSIDKAREHFDVAGSAEVFTPAALVASAFEKIFKKSNYGSSFSVMSPFFTVMMGIGDIKGRDSLFHSFLRFSLMKIIMLPFMVLESIAIPMKVFQWIGQDVRQLEQDGRRLKIKELPTPAPDCKYMIFSDLHRDCPEDIVDPVFFDVSHFTKNKNLYLKVLDYCSKNGFIVIENGDCEDLWYAPDPQKIDETARAVSILSCHADVYAVIKALHDNGRYFRTQGNHDNFWIDEINAKLLRDVISEDFTVWDGLIIPGVKTMESSFFDLARKVYQDIKDYSGKEFLKRILKEVPFGLSPDRYTDKLPMLIMHGHQFDFWNCEEHSFLGKAITQGIAVPADGLDAFPYYLKGIDWDGNPLLKFGEIIGKISPWKSWIIEDYALKMTREIEQMKEIDRKLIDDFMFSESFAVLMSYMLKYGEEGNGQLKNLQMLLGHTHYPQSRPHLNLGSFFKPAEFIDKLVKASYFNSGGGGWWEGVIWAIQVDSSGQPKLVYWDKQCDSPQVMDWELHDEAIEFNQYIDQFIDFLDSAEKEVKSATNLLVKNLKKYFEHTSSLSEIQNGLTASSQGNSQSNQGNNQASGQSSSQALTANLSFKTSAKSESALNTALLSLVSGNNARTQFDFTINLNKLPMKATTKGIVSLISKSGMFKLFTGWTEFMQGTDEHSENDIMCSMLYTIAWLTKNPLLAKFALLLSAAGNSGKTSTVTYDNNTKVMELSIGV